MKQKGSAVDINKKNDGRRREINHQVRALWNDALDYYQKAQHAFVIREFETVKLEAKNAIIAGLAAFLLVNEGIFSARDNGILDKAYEICSFDDCDCAAEYIKRGQLAIDFFTDFSPLENRLWIVRQAHRHFMN